VPGHRFLMRVSQILEQQSLTPVDLHWKMTAPLASELVFTVACEESLALRIHAKLLHLHDIREAELSVAHEKTETS
jgi:hypothetical protein